MNSMMKYNDIVVYENIYIKKNAKYIIILQSVDGFYMHVSKSCNVVRKVVSGWTRVFQGE